MRATIAHGERGDGRGTTYDDDLRGLTNFLFVDLTGLPDFSFFSSSSKAAKMSAMLADDSRSGG